MYLMYNFNTIKPIWPNLFYVIILTKVDKLSFSPFPPFLLLIIWDYSSFYHFI